MVTRNDDIERESSLSWDIIAELSKNETTDVYSMLLNHYNNCGKKIETDIYCSIINKYLSYPALEMKELFTEYNMSKFYDEFYEEPVIVDLKKKKAKAKAKSKIPTRERIRYDQIKLSATKAVCFFPKKKKELDVSFKNNIIEVIILYYLNTTHYAFTKKKITDFMNCVLSLRDSFLYFEKSVNPIVNQIVKKYFIHIKNEFPWQSFLSHHTHYLLKNHFKNNFQKAPKPFPEQASLLNHIKNTSLHTLYTLPWGVGTGKTAMLPPLASIYSQQNFQTLYCVPFGPVRDQAAALLYRCGVPFAYIVPATNGCQNEFELQPSFMCGEGVNPIVFIVHPKFVKHYIHYWNSFDVLLNGNTDIMDTTDNPPDVYIPSCKARYAHLSHHIWNPDYALIIDEPSDQEDDILWILNNLPRTTFVMSATSWELVSESVKNLYKMKYDSEPITITASTVGVSTTLIAHWLKDKQHVLSPFTGIKTKKSFQQRTEYIRNKILWRRFLSADVMVDWIQKIQSFSPETLKYMPYDFDLYTITFDSLSFRILEWCDTLSQNEAFDDTFYQNMFSLPDNSDEGCDSIDILTKILTTDSHQFLGGCIIGVPQVDQIYSSIKPLLSDFPTIQDVDKKIEQYRKIMIDKYVQWKKFPVNNQTDLIKKKENLQEIENKRSTSLPVPENKVINTAAFIEEQTGTKAPLTSKLTRIQELFESGDPLKDTDGWRIFADKMKGNFESDYENELRWRWKGVGGINFHKEFNMKNIRDSDAGYLAFLFIDTIGAYGLNLKIKHGILMKGSDGSMLPPATCLQLAGRVGRWGQEGSGYVHITDRDIFETVFSH